MEAAGAKPFKRFLPRTPFSKPVSSLERAATSKVLVLLALARHLGIIIAVNPHPATLTEVNTNKLLMSSINHFQDGVHAGNVSTIRLQK